jgi:signal transduction histidine kinase
MIDKGLLFAFCILLLCKEDTFLLPVLTGLFALIYTALSLYLTEAKKTGFLQLMFLVLCFWQKELFVFFPLLCYDAVWFWGWKGLGSTAVGTVALVWLYRTGALEGWQLVLGLFCTVLAVISSHRTKERQNMEADFIHFRDSSTELENVMQKRQKELLEKQDYEIHLATLQERNRIAREIHDNVGHMLTRSILQMGALMTIHKEEPLHGQLESVNDTLNEAMNNIRESVHDLHNESLDLKQAVREAVAQLKERCSVSLDYDMSEQTPRNVKYCFVAIVKEAVANIAKHSNADKVTLILREHPGFYQMSIEDNGTEAVLRQEAGIGLSNMKDRVEALNGNIHFFTEKGFRILISIPK